MLLLRILLFICLCGGAAHAGKQRTVSTGVADADRTLDGWLGLSLEVLKLKLNSLNLSSRGSLSVLARRLFIHFNPPPALNNITLPTDPTLPTRSTTRLRRSVVDPELLTSTNPSSAGVVTIDAVREEFRAMIPELVAALGSSPLQPVQVPLPLMPDNDNVRSSDTNIMSSFILNETVAANTTNISNRSVAGHMVNASNLLNMHSVSSPQHNATTTT